jgi:hypothetical protein
VKETYVAFLLLLSFSFLSPPFSPKKQAFFTVLTQSSHRDNGVKYTFKALHDLIFATRSRLTNRQLLSQTIVVAPTPGDGEGRTGTVSESHQFSALQDGKEVIVTIVGVLQIGWDEVKMRRQLTMESFLLVVE